MGDATADVKLFGCGLGIPTGGRPTPEVCGQPPDGIVGEGGVGYGLEEFGVVHDVKGFG